MKKAILYILVTLLYLATPICIMGILGTAVSKKYEVDEGYWHIDANKTLTEQQSKTLKEKLDKQGENLDKRIAIYIVTGLASFVIATALLAKRGKLLAGKKTRTTSLSFP